MKTISAIILAGSMLFASVSFAGMDENEPRGKRDEYKAERKAEMEEKREKVKAICKTDKVKCDAIKQLRQKYKAEMEALIG